MATPSQLVTVKIVCCVTSDVHTRKVKVAGFAALRSLVESWFPELAKDKTAFIFSYVDEDGDECRVDSEFEFKDLADSAAAEGKPARLQLRRPGFEVPMLPPTGTTQTFATFSAAFGASNNSTSNFSSPDKADLAAAPSAKPAAADSTSAGAGGGFVHVADPAAAPAADGEVAAAAATQEEEKKPAENPMEELASPIHVPADTSSKPAAPQAAAADDKKPAAVASEEKKEVNPFLLTSAEKKEVEVKKEEPAEKAAPAPAAASPTPAAETKNHLSPKVRAALREALPLLSNVYKVDAAAQIIALNGGAFKGAVRIQANLTTGEVNFDLNNALFHEHVALRLQELLGANDAGTAAHVAGDTCRLFPQSHSARYNYALCLCKTMTAEDKSQADTALAELQHAVYLGADAAAARSDPDFAPLATNLVFRMLGADDESITHFTPLMEMFPNMTLTRCQQLMSKHKNDLEAAANEFLTSPVPTSAAVRNPFM